jgi:hypothetical protein
VLQKGNNSFKNFIKFQNSKINKKKIQKVISLVGENWVVQQRTIGLFPGSANFGKTSQLFYYHMTNLIQSKSII